MWALVELIEAATRTGDAEQARDVARRLARADRGERRRLGARHLRPVARAPEQGDEPPSAPYREAIDRLGRTRLRPHLARAHLLYGEWLRREHRRIDARTQLRAAHDLLTSDRHGGVRRARPRSSWPATGESVRKRTVETRDELTAQERQIARLARDGLSNPEIGAQLFLSPRTVEWHLRKVFGKLDIRSRHELASALPSSETELGPAG